jgi:uncharacterized protein YhaN
MRIQRLDLLRYGRFTDTHIELPESNSDIHIVFGPNEAGKSTTLSAIEDLLFGISNNSPYDFLHDYGSMRIGAILENGGKTLEVRRRKGHKDTLLTADELPIVGGTGALAPYLAGADQTFFARMFSLDHERLRKGGREILEAQDEVGQMLFSAGAGLSGLRHRLKALTDEADGLWASRKAGHRKYYQALGRLDGADKALREHTVTATKWQEIKRAYDDARGGYDALEKEIEGNLSNQRKFSRIRRVYRDIRKITVLNEEIAALEGVVSLPEDARLKLEVAEREHAGATTRVETLNEQLESERSQRDALKCNDELLLRQDDIQQFHKHRIEVQKEKADLPNRRAELASAEAHLRRLADELEWEVDDIKKLVNRIPPRARAAAVRALLNSRGERASGIANAKAAVEEAEGQITDIEQELDGMAAPVDVSKLAAVVKATREIGDLESRINAAEGETREANAAIQRRLKSLKPQVAVEEALASILVPPRDTVQNHRDAVRSADQQMQARHERIRTAEQDLARHRKAHERLARDEDAVAPKDVVDARERRDSGWSLIRRRYIEGTSVRDAEIRAFAGAAADLPGTYEAAIGAADALADRRSENARAAAQIAVTSRQIAEQQELLEGLRDQESTLAEESRAFESAWQKMWEGAPFEPLAPDSMLEWLTCRDEILEAVERRAAGERLLKALRREESETKARILAELAALGPDAEVQDDQPLRILMEAAAIVQIRRETDATSRGLSEDRLRKKKAEADRKRKALQAAETAWAGWQTEWVAAIKVLSLGVGTQPEAAAAQLDAIDRMREIAAEVNQLRHERIEKIERDIDLFAHDVETLVSAVANDLAKVNPEDAILELERRLEEAKRVHEQQKSKDSAISSLQKKIEECETSGREARETIWHLQEAAGANDIDQLKAAIQNSEKLRKLESERSQVMDALEMEGDGLSLDELSEECAAVDIDQIAAREQTLEQEIKELRARIMEAAEIRTQTRIVFDAIGGDSRAAEAAAVRQAALAEMREVAEQYVCVRSAATLLQWAIDRYRQEKQAPLLKRAGEIFSILTGASFGHLRAEFDEHDRAQLAGLRPDGELVRVGGMSTGTADQLYLALRVASVEDYLDRANALPFVADDLFINFDDARAAAGFEVLGELGTKTQILFFTHHQHLVEIAKATLGKSINVLSLFEPQSAIAA